MEPGEVNRGSPTVNQAGQEPPQSSRAKWDPASFNAALFSVLGELLDHATAVPVSHGPWCGPAGRCPRTAAVSPVSGLNRNDSPNQRGSQTTLPQTGYEEGGRVGILEAQLHKQAPLRRSGDDYGPAPAVPGLVPSSRRVLRGDDPGVELDSGFSA